MVDGAEKLQQMIKTTNQDQTLLKMKFHTTLVLISKSNSFISYVYKEQFSLGKKRMLSVVAKNTHSSAKTQMPHQETPLGYKKTYLRVIHAEYADMTWRMQCHFRMIRYQRNTEKLQQYQVKPRHKEEVL